MAATLLKQGRLETALVGRGLEGFQRRVEVELQPSGVMELDAVLGGGFPRGSLVELYGPASSGRTSLAFSLLAEATERQQACAFVDVADSLDPLSLAAAGVDLPRLLWIRCGETGDRGPNVKTPSYFAGVGKETGKTRGFGAETNKPMQIHGWRHPRELMRGVENAIPSIVGKQTVDRYTSSLAARKSKSNETGNLRGEVFALHDLCRWFVKSIHRSRWVAAR